MQSLLKYNTFNIDHSCNAIYEPTSVEEVVDILPELRKMPLLIIGGGSNLLLTKDFPGNAVHPAIMGKEVLADDASHPDSVLLRVGAGEEWDDVVDYAISQGLYGMENLSLIPGNAGASAVQNIGAYGVEAKDLIHKVEAVEIASGKMHTFSNTDCTYTYRCSRFKGEWRNRFIITHVTYRLSRTFAPNLDYGNIRQSLEQKNIVNPTAQDVRNVVIEIRKSKLPDHKVIGNGGSFFMNPIVAEKVFSLLKSTYPDMPYYEAGAHRYKIPAGWMIEQCGWKGKSLGAAAVHDKQALVLVNLGGATGEDILRLCNAIRADVKARFGLELTPEVNIV